MNILNINILQSKIGGANKMTGESDKKEETTIMLVCRYWHDKKLPRPASFYLTLENTRCDRCASGLGFYEPFPGVAIVCDYYKVWLEKMKEKSAEPKQESGRDEHDRT
jgi:hypothetical protein